MSFIVAGPNGLLLASRWDGVGETIMYNLQVIKSHSHNAEQEWKWFLESRGGQMAMLMVIVRSNVALKMGTLCSLCECNDPQAQLSRIDPIASIQTKLHPKTETHPIHTIDNPSTARHSRTCIKCMQLCLTTMPAIQIWIFHIL